MYGEKRPLGQMKLELRTSADGKGTTVFGRAIKYGEKSGKLFKRFKERIEPGTFRSSVNSTRDVILTINHDTNRILGRRSAGTLRVREDDAGVTFECDMPDTSYAKDFEVSLRRGDTAGMSFGMDVQKDSWSIKGDERLRHVHEATLDEIAVGVAYPAYEEGQAALRSLEKAEEDFNESQRNRARLAEVELRALDLRDGNSLNAAGNQFRETGDATARAQSHLEHARMYYDKAEHAKTRAKLHKDIASGTDDTVTSQAHGRLAKSYSRNKRAHRRLAANHEKLASQYATLALTGAPVQ